MTMELLMMMMMSLTTVVIGQDVTYCHPLRYVTYCDSNF